MLRPPIFVGSGENKERPRSQTQSKPPRRPPWVVLTRHGKVQLRRALWFGRSLGSGGVLGRAGAGGEGPNLFAGIADRLTRRAFDWFAGSGTPLVAWICLHKSIFILKEQPKRIFKFYLALLRSCTRMIWSFFVTKCSEQKLLPPWPCQCISAFLWGLALPTNQPRSWWPRDCPDEDAPAAPESGGVCRRGGRHSSAVSPVVRWSPPPPLQLCFHTVPVSPAPGGTALPAESAFKTERSAVTQRCVTQPVRSTHLFQLLLILFLLLLREIQSLFWQKRVPLQTLALWPFASDLPSNRWLLPSSTLHGTRAPVDDKDEDCDRLKN